MLQVALKDLSWEDKELVLRVLFAKMNGAASGPSRSAMQMQQYAQARTQQHTGDMPEPVFLSEGADMPASAGAMEYQGNFEVFQQYSREAPSAKQPPRAVSADGSSYGFNMIGGGSLHSSQFDGLSGAASQGGGGMEEASLVASTLDSSSHY